MVFLNGNTFDVVKETMVSFFTGAWLCNRRLIALRSPFAKINFRMLLKQRMGPLFVVEATVGLKLHRGPSKDMLDGGVVSIKENWILVYCVVTCKHINLLYTMMGHRTLKKIIVSRLGIQSTF